MGYERKTRLIRIIHGLLSRMTGFALILAALYIGSCVYEIRAFTARGLGGEGFPGFDELTAENPDTAAWIRMDGTHIDHPVVRGRDNFEYLNKDHRGEFYQGGSIFLDAGNAKDLGDEYIILHGHHMSGGAMFSDLTLYLEDSFFEENRSGELITPDAIYALTVCGAGTVDAYDGEVYSVSPEREKPMALIDACANKREIGFRDADKLVVLSTCSGDMTSARCIVMCRARRM